MEKLPKKEIYKPVNQSDNLEYKDGLGWVHKSRFNEAVYRGLVRQKDNIWGYCSDTGFTIDSIWNYINGYGELLKPYKKEETKGKISEYFKDM